MFQSEVPFELGAEFEKHLASATEEAIQTLNEFRDREGAAIATEISPSAAQTLWARTAAIPAGIEKAISAMTNLRARLTGQPRFMQKPDNHPPAMLPKLAAKGGIHANMPICFRLNPRACSR